MPSLSINSRDLDQLGLNVKDIFKAISNSKGSDKIKKKKKKAKSKLRHVGKIDKMNPFPSYLPRLNPYQYYGGGGGLIMVLVVIQELKLRVNLNNNKDKDNKMI